MASKGRGSQRTERRGRTALLATGVPVLLVVALTAMFALDPWGEDSSGPSSGTSASPSTTNGESHDVRDRAEFPKDMCSFIKDDPLGKLVESPDKTEPTEGSSIGGKNLRCRVEGQDAGPVSLSVDIERILTDHDPVEGARSLFEVGCEGLGDDGSGGVAVRSLEISEPIGNDVCGKVEFEREYGNISVRLFAFDGPDSISISYTRYKTGVNTLDSPEVDRIERDVSEFTRQLIEKLRG